MANGQLTGKKILILTVNAGAGHIQASKAIQNGFSQLGYQAEMIDCLDFSWHPFKRIYSDGYIWLIKKFPDIWRALYKSSDNWLSIEKSSEMRKRIKRLFLSRFVKFLKEYNPDAIVCTHFLPLEISTDLKRDGKINCPILCAITDFRVHRFWMVGNKYVDKFLVASEITKRDLMKRTPRIREDKIMVTGIPVKYQEKIRTNIPSLHEFNILVLCGAFSVMSLEKVVNYIDRIKEYFKITVAVGRNEDLIRKLRGMKFYHEVEVLGFVDNMIDLMKQCDIVISKAGGIVSSEAMAAGLPMLIVDPIPGQEDNNKKYLVKKGAALSISKLNRLRDIKHNIIGLINNPVKIELMKGAAKNIGKPNAALNCAAEVLRNL